MTRNNASLETDKTVLGENQRRKVMKKNKINKSKRNRNAYDKEKRLLSRI